MRSVRAGLDERFSVIVPLGAGLGMRQGEILGVSIDDFDEDAHGAPPDAADSHHRANVGVRAAEGWEAADGSGLASILAEVQDHEQRFPSVAVTLPWKEPDGETVTARCS